MKRHRLVPHFTLAIIIALAIVSLSIFSVQRLTAATPAITLSGAVTSTDLQAWSFAIDVTVPVAIQLTCTDTTNVAERVHSEVNQVASHYDVVLHGLKANTPYRCVAETSGKNKQYSNSIVINTAPLPSDLVAPVIQTRFASNNYILYSYSTQGKNDYLVIIDQQGIIRWYYIVNNTAGDCNNAATAYSPNNGGTIFFGDCVISLDKQMTFPDTADQANSIKMTNNDGTQIMVESAEDANHNPAIVEVNATGQIIWRAQFSSKDIVSDSLYYINGCNLFTAQQAGCGN